MSGSTFPFHYPKPQPYSIPITHQKVRILHLSKNHHIPFSPSCVSLSLQIYCLFAKILEYSLFHLIRLLILPSLKKQYCILPEWSIELSTLGEIQNEDLLAEPKSKLHWSDNTKDGVWSDKVWHIAHCEVTMVFYIYIPIDLIACSASIL